MKSIMTISILFGLSSMAMAGTGLNCNKNITCKKDDSGGHSFMTCTDGRLESLCFLVAPASGVNYVCDCGISCKFPGNNLDSNDYTCSKENE